MNRLPGTVVGVESADGVMLVDVAVEDLICTATLIGSDGITSWSAGMATLLLFQETEVSLARNRSGLISLRNIFPCVVKQVEQGRLLSRVDLDFQGQHIVSVITSRSIKRLNLQAGDRVEALVKANEMTLLPSDSQS